MLTPLEGTPPLYSKIVDISGKNESPKERRINTQNIYYIGLYPREVVILEGHGEGSNVKETKTRRGELPVPQKGILCLYDFCPKDFNVSSFLS